MSSFGVQLVSGAGGKAAFTGKLGLVMAPDGKPYLLQIISIRDASSVSMDKDLSVAGARAVAAT